MKRLVAALVVSMAGSLAVPARVDAQIGYFGQNKVQYRTFTFQVMKTDHFDIYFYPEEEAAARMAGRMAERWYTRLSTLLRHEMKMRQPLILYGSGSQFRQTNVVEGDLGEGTGGVTEAYKRRIVLPFAGPIQATDHVLGHEIVHAFQYSITNTTASGAAGGNAGALSLPLWFIEGMAEYLSLGPDDPHTAMWMRESVRREKLPDIDDLDNPRYFPYRYGEALWAYIGGRYGDEMIGPLLRQAAGNNGYDVAFQKVLGIKTKELSKAWHDATFAAYRPLAETTRMPKTFARALITDESGKGGMNVSPVLSPDGSKIVFFSSRDLFSIDLYVADATTGKVLHKITDTATNAHLDSIEFIDSAGAWSHDGRLFAFPGLSGGKAILTIVDAERGKKEREITLDTVDQVVNPTWSPDGRQIAFAAMIGGFTDLFAYDLESNRMRRLTNDAFAEIQPAWSPDGRSIAFSTDRFTTNIRDLRAGNLRLAVLDLSTGQTRELGGFDDGKNINPQWAPDGRALYFVSDRRGISNIYRLDTDTGSTTQLTNLLTGATGITELSPAMSVSASRLAFSVYENDGYNIYALDAPQQLAGLPLESSIPRDAGVLPPRTSGGGLVYSYLNNTAAGLPVTNAFPAEDYKPRLSLDFLGQPMVGFGVDSFGSYVGGGISAMFSDVLGNHVVAGDIQTTSRFDETGGSVLYLNRTHRWNWGASLDQTPYVLRGFTQSLGVQDGQTFVEEDEFRTVQTDRGFSGILMYPFSRAQRVEFSGGLRQIGGKQDVTVRLFDPSTGQQFAEQTQRLNTFPTLNLGIASTALVYDTSIFGVTSPIRGSRYRLQLDQTSGSITYGAALADGRTYMMPVRPITIAVRGMYYGRYGRSAQDPLLTPVFIGYPELVRGYDYGSFRADECGVTSTGSCPVIDQLIGSRMIVANAEVRAPLWSLFGGRSFYGPLPIEVAGFADAGAAWDRSRSLRLTGNDRNLVRSVGAAMRVNLFGYAVGEIDYVRPLDRPLRGWMWQFSLRPGF